MDKFREMVIIAGWPYSMTKSDYHIVGYIPIPMINTTSNKQKKYIHCNSTQRCQGSPLGKGTVLLRGPLKGREAERHFGKARKIFLGTELCPV